MRRRRLKEIEGARTMPLLTAIVVSSSNTTVSLMVRNEGAGPVLQITVAKHEAGNPRFSEDTLIPLLRQIPGINEPLKITAVSRSVVESGLLVSVSQHRAHSFTSSGSKDQVRGELVERGGLLDSDERTVYRKGLLEPHLSGY
jgi:hypothetical protein